MAALLSIKCTHKFIEGNYTNKYISAVGEQGCKCTRHTYFLLVESCQHIHYRYLLFWLHNRNIEGNHTTVLIIIISTVGGQRYKYLAIPGGIMSTYSLSPVLSALRRKGGNHTANYKHSGSVEWQVY